MAVVSTRLNKTLQKFSLAERAGREAAALWLACAPLSMGEFRDLRFRNLIDGHGTVDNFAARRAAFNEAFARSIATAIAQQSRAEVRNG